MRKFQKRLLIFLLLLAFAAVNVFAGAVGEAIANFVIGGLAVIGGTVGAFFTGGATAGVAVAGAGMIMNGVNILQEDKQKTLEYQNQLKSEYDNAYNNYINAQQLVNSIQANIDTTEVNILQTESNISAFDQTLVRWQSQYDIQRNQLQMEGESAYSQLMQNWQGAELVNATRGQTGGSAALVAESQAMQVERLAGKDMKLDENGGLFGTSLNEFRLDMLAGRNELVGNMKISQEALVKYNSALSSYKSSLASAQSAMKTAYSNMQTSKQAAINAGVDASYFGA